MLLLETIYSQEKNGIDIDKVEFNDIISKGGVYVLKDFEITYEYLDIALEKEIKKIFIEHNTCEIKDIVILFYVNEKIPFNYIELALNELDDILTSNIDVIWGLNNTNKDEKVAKISMLTRMEKIE